MQKAIFLQFIGDFPSADEIVPHLEKRLGVKLESRLRVVTAHYWLLSFAPNGQWSGPEVADINFDAREKLAVVEVDSPPTKMQAALVAAL